MPSAKSGSAGSAVSPATPKAPEEADQADPGEIEEIKARQRQAEEGKYGSVKTQPHKPDEAKKSWIEIEVVDGDDKPVPGERYSITLPDGQTVASGTTDDKGFARVDGIDPGTCKVWLSDRDGEAWEKA